MSQGHPCPSCCGFSTTVSPSSCKLADAGSWLPFELIFPTCRMLHPPSHWVFNYYWSIGAQDKLFYVNAPTEACCLTSYCVDACHKGNSFLLTSCVLCGYWSLSSIVFQTSFPPCPSVLASCPHLGILRLLLRSHCVWAGERTSGDSCLLLHSSQHPWHPARLLTTLLGVPRRNCSIPNQRNNENVINTPPHPWWRVHHLRRCFPNVL